MDKIFGMDKLLVLAVVILIVIVAIAVGVSLSGSDDNGDNGNGGDGRPKRWEDLYQFKQYLYNNYSVVEKTEPDTSVITNVENPEDAVWVVVGVEKEFTPEEASAVRSFVNDGGDVIIASDSTLANKVSLQFAVEFTEERIIETTKYDRSELFVQMEAYVGGTSYDLLLNSPIYLDHNENVTTIDIDVLAQSSGWTGFGEFSFIDLNDNGEADMDDVIDQFPTIIEVKFGKGKIIFIGDTAIFTDDLWDRQTDNADYENSEFCKDLLKYTVSRQGTVIYDISKHETYQSGHKIYPE